MAIWKRPGRVDYPSAMPCLKCDSTAKRHCSPLHDPLGNEIRAGNHACSWYDCYAKSDDGTTCNTRTYIVVGIPPSVQDGRRFWQCLSRSLWW